MNTVRFYSKEEEKEILRIVKDKSINIREASEKFAIKYNRGANAVEVKIYKMRRTLFPTERPKNRSRKRDSIISPIVTIKKPVVEQQPAEIGIEVPHGMTFEGTPKKIMLHSDHFRIYF